MNPHYPVVAERAGHRCEYCHAPEAIFNFPFEVEHILASSRRGSEDLDNLALACRACNLWKAEHAHGVDEVTGLEVALFHPRQDQWAEHLQVSPDIPALSTMPFVLPFCSEKLHQPCSDLPTELLN